MTQIICVNCKKEIKNKGKACYSREVNRFFCSLGCLTDFAHEYLICIPISQVEERFLND